MKEPVMESVFSFELWRSLLLVKLAVEEPMTKAVAQTVFNFRLWWSLSLAKLLTEFLMSGFSFRL